MSSGSASLARFVTNIHAAVVVDPDDVITFIDLFVISA
jgi:hypothetical protein